VAKPKRVKQDVCQTLRHRIEIFIKLFWVANFYSPSIRDISAAFGLSLSHVHWILSRLEKDGAIILRTHGKSRSIVPIAVMQAIQKHVEWQQ